jgi:hypothetical protein
MDCTACAKAPTPITITREVIIILSKLNEERMPMSAEMIPENRENHPFLTRQKKQFNEELY